MKVLIAVDMEGVTGVTRWEETDDTHKEYPRFRKIMTDEINAAIAGAAEAGADELVVTDGHGDGTNVLIEYLDQRAVLNSGGESPLAMVQGVDSSTAGLFFIGYHARAGSRDAVLAHTWSASRIANVWLNGVLVGEYGLNASVAGHFGVPVLMISGDQTACAQAENLLGKLETVVVKRASGYFSAECLSPGVTMPAIREAARRAITRLKDGTAPKPFIINPPINLAIEFRQPVSADRALRIPGMKRMDDMRLEFDAPDMLTAYAGFRVAVKQARD
jgi:D-amino peptidase